MRRRTEILLWSCILTLPYNGSNMAAAQATTGAMLDSAVRFHQNLQIERAIPILRNIISPGSPYEVSRSQRVLAYKYLGASLALQGDRDSALIYFRAAIERDPFTDLDRSEFVPQQLEAFEEARHSTFGVSVRRPGVTTFDPRTEVLELTTVSTHESTLRVTIGAPDRDDRVVLFEGDNNGIREVTWNGLVAGGRLAPRGTYEILVTGASRLSDRSDTTVVYVDVGYLREALEDTLPDLTPAELLPEYRPPSSAAIELAKGVLVGGIAIAIPSIVGNSALGASNRSMPLIAGGTAIGAGVVSFLVRQNNRVIQENVEENARKNLDRVRRNLAIQARNQARVNETKLVVSPVAGIIE